MIKPDTLEKPVKVVYLGIGSNIGNRIIFIERAKSLLLANDIQIISTSSYYETPSWPNPKNPKFINIVLKVECSQNPAELLSLCKKIEVILGRKKSPKNAPRECDIDILDYDQKVYKIKNKNDFIYIPHPRLHQRNFVLLPLFEISKNWKYPKKNKKICDLLNSLGSNNLRTIKLT